MGFRGEQGPFRPMLVSAVKSKRLTSGWLMVMIASWPAVAVAQGDSSVSDCHVPRALSALQPHPEGVKTLVRVGVFVIDVARIDETMESATMDLLLVARWNDPRLAADNFGRSLEHCHFLPGDVWEPGITLANQRRVISIGPGQLLVDRDGNVEFLRRYFLDLSTPFDLANFPFDPAAIPSTISISSLAKAYAVPSTSCHQGI